MKRLISLFVALLALTSPAFSAVIFDSVTGLSAEVSDQTAAQMIGSQPSRYSYVVKAAPSPMPEGLQLWFDASDATTITSSGGAVSLWRDKSQNGNNASQATGSAQPTIRTAAQNRLNTIRFTAANSQLMTLSTPITMASYTVISVKRRAGPAGPNNIILVGTGASAGYVCSWDSAGVVTIFGNNQYYTTPALSTTNYVVFTVAKTSGYAYAHAIGNQLSLAGPSAVVVSNTFDTIGASSGTYTNGEIAEMLVFNRILSRRERESVEGYLAAKWNADAL